jgi:hypothetical protein
MARLVLAALSIAVLACYYALYTPTVPSTSPFTQLKSFMSSQVGLTPSSLESDGAANEAGRSVLMDQVVMFGGALALLAVLLSRGG